MKLLTNDNQPFQMNDIPDDDVDIRFAILDYSNPKDVDYFFQPLIFLESFSAPAVELKINNKIMQMPMDWSIVIGEKEIGDLETIGLSSLNDRGFRAFSFNPITGSIPTWPEIEILNIYPDMKWFFPKLKHGHILCTPLENRDNPECVYFVKDTHKIPEQLDIGKVVT